MRFRVALLLGILLRVALLLWGTYQDAHGPVKYTDIDYFVFTDASTCLVSPDSSPHCSPARGHYAPTWLGDPYSRATYRYTPLLALLLTPNHLLFPSFGKLLFATADLVVAVLLYRLMKRRGSSQSTASNTVALTWLLNPMIANISTRGSSESIVGALVVSALSFAEGQEWDKAAVVYGFAVHFKIFPVIYGSSLLVATMFKPNFSLLRPLRFGLVSFLTFMALNVPLYLLCAYFPPVRNDTSTLTFGLAPTFSQMGSTVPPRNLPVPPFTPRPPPQLLPLFLLLLSLFLLPILLYSRPRLPILAPFIRSSSARSFLTSNDPLPWSRLRFWREGSTIRLDGTDFCFRGVQQSLHFAGEHSPRSPPLFVVFLELWLRLIVTLSLGQYFLWYLWLLPPALARLHLSRSRAISTVSIWVLSQVRRFSHLWLATLELSACTE